MIVMEAIDWEAEIERYFTQKLAEHSITGVDARALQHFGKKCSFSIFRGHIDPYRQVLRETMKMAFDHFHLPYAEADVEEFANAMGRWKPFPDTRDAIVELQKFLKVVLITNTDNDIIAETERTIGVTFDEIITAQQARAYKPSHKGFLLARERLGLPKSEIGMLVLGSNMILCRPPSLDIQRSG